MNKLVSAVALGAMLGLAACHSAGPDARPPLTGARIGGPFTLTDQDGHPFSSASLKGRYPIIYFGYTFCPDVCPTDMQVLAKGLKQLEQEDPVRAAKVQPIFITVDPARDTPPVLKTFVRAFSPRLIGLTGSEAQIAAVAKDYAAPFSKQAPTKGATGYLMQHSTAAILFGPDGQPIALVPVDADAAQVAATLKQWVR
ncbi:protein SCO1/2 [Sphingomonas vulcanisoli]|uniref:Protein SCO1/2 n=1 Tax=Sphingomonas vulcanisoli TaxID=1658060 RepID=A0ABX0TPF6_9SPHN|nr:SCO family protein [Sphingomonas vulcanisoli]NIJ07419.1 protein SCO1/2 [Sphingomonas vulcanisoli]